MKESFGQPRRSVDPGFNAMPLELQLDLLVDEELPEDRRRALLLQLDRDPSGGGWRTLSMRFLERQAERRSVRDLIAGGRLLPVEESPANYRIPRSYWAGWRGVSSIAAGLLIAVGSAVMTGYWVQHRAASTPAPTNEIAKTAALPGPAVGAPQAEPAVEYRVVSDKPFTEALFAPSANGEAYTQRRSVIIQPDTPGKAMVIPVNTLPMRVY